MRFEWTDRKLNILRHGASNGMDSYELAEVLGCNRYSVVRKANELKVKLHKSGTKKRALAA